MNRVFLVGRLGQDPELRSSKGGLPWCTLSVATDRSRKEGDAWVEETDWHDVRVFGADAERCHQRLRRGTMVAVEGALVYETWVDETGAKRRRPRVVATRVQGLTDLKTAEAPVSAVPRAEEPAVEPTLDALPF